MRTGGKFWLRLREMTACFALLWFNVTRLSLPHFSITVRSLERSEAEMFLWSGISLEAWSFGLNENDLGDIEGDHSALTMCQWSIE